MKNVTISMDEELYRLTRIEAAKAGVSMSRYLAAAAEQMNAESGKIEGKTKRERQLAAIESILAGPKWSVMENGRMPTAEERNARR